MKAFLHSKCNALADPAWFRRTAWLFAFGVLPGLGFWLLGPVPAIRTLGAIAAVCGALGVAVSLLGARLAQLAPQPARWRRDRREVDTGHLPMPNHHGAVSAR
jgi:hypothetical protein